MSSEESSTGAGGTGCLPCHAAASEAQWKRAASGEATMTTRFLVEIEWMPFSSRRGWEASLRKGRGPGGRAATTTAKCSIHGALAEVQPGLGKPLESKRKGYGGTLEFCKNSGSSLRAWEGGVLHLELPTREGPEGDQAPEGRPVSVPIGPPSSQHVHAREGEAHGPRLASQLFRKHIAPQLEGFLTTTRGANA